SSIQIVLVLWIAAWGCDGNTSSQPPRRAGARGPAAVEAAPSRKTTSEGIAVTNLNASIEASRRRLEAGLDVATASALIEQLMLRADFYRSFDDWEEASKVSRAVLEAHPTNPAAILLRARVLNTLHEFDAALALIEEARAQKSSSGAVAAGTELEAQAKHLEASIRLAQGGPVDELVARRRALATSLPTYQNITSSALALAQQGRFGEADAVFRSALEQYRDVSPFPFAWVAFQRGVMWSEQAARPDLGRPLYEEALGYLPGYVLANVHLAELDALGGDVQTAIGRVEPLVGRTQDPEPLALLATLEPSIDRARRYAVQADAAYRQLIERFPEAFAHHDPTHLSAGPM
ncbi:MAG: hypothetical protein O7F08_08430, partial [Deltaproteobacteria bacterium]|nr:hypothetical protein [Deltaproteobacteria bacterium]